MPIHSVLNAELWYTTGRYNLDLTYDKICTVSKVVLTHFDDCMNTFIQTYKNDLSLQEFFRASVSRSYKSGNLLFLAATKQLYDWFSPSVRPSVRLSVRPSVTPFSPCSHHRIIIKFSGVITMVKSDVHAKGQGQRSKVKVTKVNTQLSRFRTLTPVWIHIWQWNHAHSWKQHRRGALLFFKVIHQIRRSHGSKNRRIWPRLGVSGL